MTSDTSGHVAIIGMAVRLPEADDVQQFFENLKEGRDSIRPISAERKERTSLAVDIDYQECGYLDDIDTFDHAFFGFSRGEANNMAPQHRLLLQTACQAVDNSSYALSAFYGQRGSVYVADTKIGYETLAATPETTLVMGSHVSAMAGRVSRFLGLRGPAAMVDTSCSSGLVAVHLAVNDLITHDADIALSCAASLDIFPAQLNIDDASDIGIRSADGRTRCFSADADGTGAGEAVVVLILKRLADAIRDDDIIHSVIKGVAVNNVGGRSNMLTAPDADAEAEVLQRAWSKASVDPSTITYIEAHGTATRLGDPIEIEAIDRAFAATTDRKQFCAISSAKSNIGHTWSASGLVGLVKATLSLRNTVLFPNVHTHSLSPLIDFDNSAAVVTREFSSWTVEGHPRRAGVSSFGVMGTNAHAVIEQAPPRRHVDCADGLPRWIPISAKSAAAAKACLVALTQWIDEHRDTRLADLQATLVGSRDHYRYRYCFIAHDIEQLCDGLRRSASVEPRAASDSSVGLIVSGQCQASEDLIASLCQTSPTFQRRYTDCRLASTDAGIPHDRGFAFQYALYGHFQAMGLTFAHIVAEGRGKLVLDACRGRIPLDQALIQAESATANEPDQLAERVDRLLAKLAGERVIFIEAGPLSTISRQLAGRCLEDFPVLALDDDLDSVTELLTQLYLFGAEWDWSTTSGDGARIELPPYQFEKTRCWINTGEPTTVQTDDIAVDLVERDTLAVVEEAWKRVLALDTVDPDESFFDIGGDSISGLQILNSLRGQYGIVFDQFAIFDHETPRLLAAHIEALRSETGAVAGLEPSPSEAHTSFPVTSGQRQIWVAAQLEGGSVSFNLTRGFHLDGTVDCDALRAAIDQLLQRHAALRVAFAYHDDILTQHIPQQRPCSPFQVVTQARSMPQGPELLDECRAIAQCAFDLESGQLFRAHLTTFAANQSVLILTTHHLVADGWSLDILVRDLFAFYRANTQGSLVDLPATGDYREELALEIRDAEPARDAARRYWLDRFSDVPQPILLPARKGAVQDFRGTYRSYRLPEDLWAHLKRFTKEQSTTTFAVAFTAFAALFARHTESGEVVLGTSLSGRSRESVENTVGMFVRTVPLRIGVRANHSIKMLHSMVRSELRLAARHDAFAYEELVDELRRAGQLTSPNLFNVLIEYEQFAGNATSPLDDSLTITAVPVTLETSVFPLNIMLSEQIDGLHAVIRYDTSLFDEQATGLLWDAYVDLLEVLLSNPEGALEDLPLVGAKTRDELLTLGYHTAEFDPSDRIHHVIERFAATTPDRLCLTGPQGQRSFEQVNSRANYLAYQLADAGIQAGDIVAILMDRKIAMVESILAVWKCGAAYLPIDPKHPIAYTESVITASGAKLVIADVVTIPAGLTSMSAPLLTTGNDDIPSQPVGNPPRPDLGASELAYVIYTSGSTGAPKGAMVEHVGMLNHLHAKIHDLQVTERSVVAQTASNSFDISVWQMFAALFMGGTTAIYDEALQLDPMSLYSRMEQDSVTVLEVVPSYLAAVLDIWRGHEFHTLEWLLVTGEVVQPKIINDWVSAFPTIPVVNAYGPTEASDDITHHIITEVIENGSVPLGRPIQNTSIYILDDRNRLVPRGETGEICVSGVAVGRGYLRAPELTAQVFTPDPFYSDRRMYRTGDLGKWQADGTLEMLGRKGTLVKVRGFRVALGAIEHRVSLAPDVRACAVVTVGNDADRLVAFVVRDETSTTIEQCADYLAAHLPHYMVPELMPIAQLPLTPNGKTDRKELERLATTTVTLSSPADRAPATAIEHALVDIWESVLERPVGVNDSFLEVGGNSLSAIKLLSRIRKQLAAEVSLQDIFAHRTIAGLATHIAPGELLADLRSLGGPGVYPVAPNQQLLLAIEASSAVREAFNRNDLFRVEGDINVAQLRKAVAMLLARHESLRTTYDVGKGQLTVHYPDTFIAPVEDHDFPDMQAAQDFICARIDTPFDVTCEPPIRFDIIRAGVGADTATSLLMSMHQLSSDGRSVEVVKDELVALYDGLSTSRPALTALPIQYKEFAAYRQLTKQAVDRLSIFWSEELDGANSTIELRSANPRPQNSTLRGGRCYRTVSAAGFNDLARRHAVTGFVVARSAVALLLLAETDQRDLTMGTYSRGRDRIEFEDQIGCYLNIVPMRVRQPERNDVGELLRQAQRDVLRAFAHQEYPYGSIMRDHGWYRGPDRSPLFDVMIGFEEWPEDIATRGTSFALVPQELPRRAKEAELQFSFGRTLNSLEIVITYNTDIFDDSAVNRLADQLCTVIDDLTEETSISEILSTLRCERALS